MEIRRILSEAVSTDASAVFMIAGAPLTYLRNGVQEKQGEEILSPNHIKTCLSSFIWKQIAKVHCFIRILMMTSLFHCLVSGASAAIFIISAVHFLR